MRRNHLFHSLDTLFGPEPGLVMRQIIQTIERVSVSDLGILIVGEEGTGKQWLARMIHRLSGRARHPLVSIDCTTVNQQEVERELFGSEKMKQHGLLQQAGGGTLSLANISDLPPALQMKIVRTFEHQHYRRFDSPEHITVNVRMIATMRKTTTAAEQEYGKEIYHRICPVMINLPPLRERREDIPFLIEQFINESNIPSTRRPRAITADALATCVNYGWPGNVGELKRVILGALEGSSDKVIHRDQLPERVRKPARPSLAHASTH
jgi:DNA-binding NtrC family response regulator